VLIAGDNEYRSEEALPQLAKILATHHGFKCTVLFSQDGEGTIDPNAENNIPGLEALKSADLMVLGLRFRTCDEQHILFTWRQQANYRWIQHASFNIKETVKVRRLGLAEERWLWQSGRNLVGPPTFVGKHYRVIAADHPIVCGIKDGDI
jgi:hypothetical protein